MMNINFLFHFNFLIKMDIHDIPKTVVTVFIDKYYPDLIFDDNYYDVLLNIIMSGEIESAPDEIVNWIIAYNNKNNDNIKFIKLSDILLDKIDLAELYEILNVNNKDDLIQILFYMHKLHDDLSIFNKLPSEILKHILMNLDTESLLLWFKINTATNLSAKDLLENILRDKIGLNYNIDAKNLVKSELIIISKIESYHDLNPDFDLKELNKFELIDLFKLLEGPKIYGAIEDNNFRITKRKSNMKLTRRDLIDSRRSIPGRKCNAFKIPELLEILWDIDGPLPNNSINITEQDRENIIQQLIGNIRIRMADGRLLPVPHGSYNYDTLNNINLDELEFIYNWTRAKLRRESFCEIIKNRMIELDLIEYL